MLSEEELEIIAKRKEVERFLAEFELKEIEFNRKRAITINKIIKRLNREQRIFVDDDDDEDNCEDDDDGDEDNGEDEDNGDEDKDDDEDENKDNDEDDGDEDEAKAYTEAGGNEVGDDEMDEEIDETERCLICFGRHSDGRTICGHYFHKICLDMWQQNSNSCPYCRSSLYYHI